MPSICNIEGIGLCERYQVPTRETGQHSTGILLCVDGEVIIEIN